MLVVDFLHEFELGVWKATFIHIIRVLYAAVPGGKAVIELNARYDLTMTCLITPQFTFGLSGFDRFQHLALILFDVFLIMPRK
jgi:hypothetical protein